MHAGTPTLSRTQKTLLRGVLWIDESVFLSYVAETDERIRRGDPAPYGDVWGPVVAVINPARAAILVGGVLGSAVTGWTIAAGRSAEYGSGIPGRLLALVAFVALTGALIKAVPTRRHHQTSRSFGLRVAVLVAATAGLIDGVAEDPMSDWASTLFLVSGLVMAVCLGACATYRLDQSAARALRAAAWCGLIMGLSNFGLALHAAATWELTVSVLLGTAEILVASGILHGSTATPGQPRPKVHLPAPGPDDGAQVPAVAPLAPYSEIGARTKAA